MTLDDIFDQQIKLNTRIIPTLYDDIKTDPDARRAWFLKFQQALSQELAEAVDSVNWKWWQNKPDDWDNAKLELVDILHFWVSLCTVAGLDAAEVMALYAKKNKLNHHRQDNGYATGDYDKYIDGQDDNKRHIL